MSGWPRPGNPGGLIVEGKVWTDATSSEGFDFTETEILVSTDGSELDVGIPGPDGSQERMLVSIPYAALLAALLTPPV